MIETSNSQATSKVQLLDNSQNTTIIANRTVANYKLVELRGTGGMASIYKAIQLSLERPVALKIMHPHLHNNETFVARFEKEAKRAAMLHHENIVSIIDYGCDNGEYYIAMEYVDGTNLSEMLKKQRKMPLEVALHVCHQVAEGLKYAHGLNLIHRDIKPANIMLSYDGRVMLTDFGIAKATGDLTITSTGQVIGSPQYMSPEQAAGRETDHRSDIFSLGIILYEIIAGEKPFKGETYQSLVTSIISDYPASLREYRVDVIQEIDDLVQKSLVKVVDSRYQTAEEFSEALFAQFSKFKLQSPRKMMADYLKNPIRITEKLRADKISDHMESALYFLAVGEGKLAEAKKEFLDVLRFDRNNREAKKQLTKLESQLPSEKRPEKFWDLKLNLGISYALAVVAIIILSMVTFSMLPKEEGERSQLLPEVVPYGGKEQKPNLIIESSAGRADGRSSQVSRSSDIGAASNTRISGNKTAMAFNYPEQHLLRYSTVKVTTNVPARLTIDSKDYSWSNGPPIKILPGRHYIEVSANGFSTAGKRVFLRREKVDTLKFELKRRP